VKANHPPVVGFIAADRAAGSYGDAGAITRVPRAPRRKMAAFKGTGSVVWDARGCVVKLVRAALGHYY
jgi:hypothetical protein